MRLDDFLQAFFPTETEPLFIRGFSPKEIPEPQRAPVYGRQLSRQLIASDPAVQQELKRLNQTHGIYFVPNTGGFKDTEITRINAVFCEIDDRPILDQHDLYDNAPLPPSIRVETKKSVHAYWLADPDDRPNREQWLNIQCGLIDYFKSDAGIKNPNRVMRLPFFSHLAWDGQFNYKRVELHTFNPETRFSPQELLEAYPYAAPVEAPNFRPNYGPGENPEDSLVGIANELRYRISLHPSYKIESDRVHATAAGICHNAVHGTTAIMVNLRTGAVYCHAGCDYWKIAEAFGLSKPKGKGGRYNVGPKPRTDKQSETGRRLLNYVYGNNEQ